MTQLVRTIDPLADPTPTGPVTMTLLDLVTAVAEFSETDAEVVATVSHLLSSGQVELVGHFIGGDLETEPPS